MYFLLGMACVGQNNPECCSDIWGKSIFEVSRNKGAYLYQGTGMANTTCTSRYEMVTTMLALTQMPPSPFVSARVKNEIVGSRLTGCVYNSIQ